VEYLAVGADIGTILTGISVFFVVIQLIKEVKGQNAQALVYIHSYLSQSELNEARHTIRTELYEKKYDLWNDEDKRLANKVCSSYDQTGLLLSTGIVSNKTKEQFLKSSWGESICHQYESLDEYMHDKQTPKKEGYLFFHHFVDLYNEASKYHRNN